VEAVLEQARKAAAEAEVFSVSQRQTQALFEANRLKLVQTRESSGMALRIIKEGRIGFSSTSRADKTELIAMALEIAPFGVEARFQFPATETYPEVEVFDPSVEETSEEEMVELGQSLIDRLRQHTPELVCQGEVSRGVTLVELLNSRGGRVSYRKSFFALGVEGVLVRDTDMLFVGDSDSSCHPIADPTLVAETTIWQLEQARRTVTGPTKKLPVIFTPLGVVSALVLPLMVAVNGKTVLQGASPLGRRLGEQVFDPRLSIWDDATIPYRPQSRVCDDEGVPSQRTPLVERGVVTSFLYDLQTAAMAGTRSTGSASRSLASLPTPSVAALVIEEGEATLAEMVADMKEGLVVDMLMGASQGNILGGEFSGNVLLGYRVEKGNIVGRVKNTMVSGNIYQVLKELVAIGSEGRWVGGSLRTPPLYCAGLAVSTKG